MSLIRAAYRGEAGWTSEAHLVEGERTDDAEVGRLITSPASRVLVARSDPGVIIACCHVEYRGGALARLGMFAVEPARQGAGVGRWLLAEAERAAADVFGARDTELSALAQQSALIAWYERGGYVRTGESRAFPAHPRFARPLRGDLRFVVMRKRVAATQP